MVISDHGKNRYKFECFKPFFYILIKFTEIDNVSTKSLWYNGLGNSLCDFPSGVRSPVSVLQKRRWQSLKFGSATKFPSFSQ